MTKSATFADAAEDATTDSGDLPEGWASVELRRLVEPSNEKVEPEASPNAPYLSLEHIEAHTGRILGHGIGSDVRSTKAVFRSGDVLYGKLRPYLNKVCIPNFEGICSTDILVFPQNDVLDSRYLRAFLSTPEVVSFANHNSSGVQLPRVSFKALGTLRLPLPPLAEQKRIVAEIERLLAEVNKAREHLDRVPKLLKRFRQSILAAACDGKLSGDDAEQWETTTLGALSSLVTSGSRGWARYYAESGPYFVRAQDINTDWLDVSGLAHVQPPTGAEGDRTRVKCGDLLVTITGANVTKAARVHVDLGEAFVSQHVGLVRLKDPTLAPFLHVWLTSPEHGRAELLDAAYGVGKPGLNLTHLRDLEVRTPPQGVREEAVSRVEWLMANAKEIETVLIAAIRKAQAAPQAILAKAFRGELVPTEAELARTQNRPYESATQLLARLSVSNAVSHDQSRPKVGSSEKAKALATRRTK